jgi:hypothetical protein
MARTSSSAGAVPASSRMAEAESGAPTCSMSTTPNTVRSPYWEKKAKIVFIDAGAPKGAADRPACDPLSHRSAHSRLGAWSPLEPCPGRRCQWCLMVPVGTLDRHGARTGPGRTSSCCCGSTRRSRLATTFTAAFCRMCCARSSRVEIVKETPMFAYLFWHAAPASIAAADYEKRLLRFGRALADAGSPGFRGNASYAIGQTRGWASQATRIGYGSTARGRSIP